MPKFSRISEDRLATCHEDLQTLFNEVIRRWDCSILCGFRSKEAQDAAYAAGASKVQWPDGNHNKFPSLAVDAIPYNRGVNWNDVGSIRFFAGKVMALAEMLYEKGAMQHRLLWGGDWDRDNRTDDQTFDDLVHFELIGAS